MATGTSIPYSIEHSLFERRPGFRPSRTGFVSPESPATGSVRLVTPFRSCWPSRLVDRWQNPSRHAIAHVDPRCERFAPNFSDGTAPTAEPFHGDPEGIRGVSYWQ